MKTLTILGSTGSIGVSTLDVVRRHPGRYRVAALCAHHQVDRLFEQCLAGNVPVPQSIKLQMACCLLATGEVDTVEAGLKRVDAAF